MYSVYLAHALLENPTHYDIVASRLDDLRWAASRICELQEPDLVSAEPAGRLLQTIILYAKNYKCLPDRVGARDYAVELMSRGAASSYGDDVKSQLVLMDEKIADAKAPPVMDIPTNINVLIESTVQEARKYWHRQNGKTYSYKATGGNQVRVEGGEKGETRESTPDDAIAWMRKQWARDWKRASTQPSGDLTDLSAFVEAEIDRMVNGDDSARILTGIHCLDEQIYISKKRRPFIGIMGFANDGKTTVLLTMLYNMAAAGQRVILFSKEHDPTELALYFAFIHSHDPHYRNQFLLPSMREFEEGHISKENGERLKSIWHDMETHKNFAGRIELQPLTDWDTLTNHLKSNQRLNRYDVCAIDYLTRLEIPGGNPRFRDQDIKNYIGAAQRLTRDFDEGRGLVLITPIQINRSGFQAARKKKEGEKKHDMTSVSQFSEFYQDMDILVSLFSDDEMRLKRHILLETQKVRKSGVRPTVVLGIDPRSEKVVDLSDMGMDTKTQAWIDSGTPMSKYVETNIALTQRDEEADVFNALEIGGSK